MGSYCRARRYTKPDSVSFRSPRKRYRSDAAREPVVPHGRPNGSYDVLKAVALECAHGDRLTAFRHLCA